MSDTQSESTPLFHLAYVSSEKQTFSQADLIELLQQVRTINEERDITGLLLYKQDAFFQILEGSEEAVMKTFRSIELDDRHHQVEVLMREPCSAREYSDWRMGFANLDGVDLSLLQGYSDFMSSPESPRAFLTELSRSERLAMLFRQLQ